jgi:hypothetical protein
VAADALALVDDESVAHPGQAFSPRRTWTNPARLNSALASPETARPGSNGGSITNPWGMRVPIIARFGPPL